MTDSFFSSSGIYCVKALGRFTRNYTQTTKRELLTTNKGWISSTGEVRDIQPVLLFGVSKGYPFGTRLCVAKCSVLYALSALLRKWGCRRGRASTFEAAGKQICDCVAWSHKRKASFISRQDVYENSRPSSHAGLRDKMSRTCGHTPAKIEMGGKPF